MSVKLLKEYIQLVVETTEPRFELTGPEEYAESDTGNPADQEHTIMRPFVLVVNGQEEAGNHAIIIHVDDYKMDSDSIYDADWYPVAVDGLILTPEDVEKLRAMMGDLTDKELQKIEAEWADVHDHFEVPDHEPRFY